MAKKKVKKTAYRLFALPMSAEAVQTAQNERFSRVCAGYALIYTTNSIKGGVEISEEESRKRLSPVETEWLFDCNTAILADEMKRSEKQILASLSQRVTALEANLAEAKRKEKAEHGET